LFVSIRLILGVYPKIFVLFRFDAFVVTFRLKILP
jgi:hypothetical protein